MELKINAMYKIPGCENYLIPRSHQSSGNGVKYSIIQILETVQNGYKTRYCTMTSNEIKKLLAIEAKEKIKII